MIDTKAVIRSQVSDDVSPGPVEPSAKRPRFGEVASLIGPKGTGRCLGPNQGFVRSGCLGAVPVPHAGHAPAEKDVCPPDLDTRKPASLQSPSRIGTSL